MNINHYSEVVKSLSFRVRIMSFISHNFHILTVWLRASYLAVLYPTSFTCLKKKKDKSTIELLLTWED